MGQSFKFDFEVFRGITQAEFVLLSEFRRKAGEDALADILDQILLIGEGGKKLVTSVSPDSRLKQIIAYGARDDGKFDLIVARGVQTKALNWGKIAGFTGVSAGLGVLAYLATGSGSAGCLVGGAGITATAGKSIYDNSQEMPDVTSGYILQQLENQNVISLAGGRIELL